MYIGYGRSCPSPASRARMTACALSATCSLRKMFEAWLRTVSRHLVNFFLGHPISLTLRRMAVDGLTVTAEGSDHPKAHSYAVRAFG